MQHTPGHWEWLIHDHSMASLGTGRNPGMGDPLVLSVSPCPACAGRADPKEWKWGRCCTPNEADARLIAAAPEMYEALKAVMDEWREGYGLNCVEQVRAALAKIAKD